MAELQTSELSNIAQATMVHDERNWEGRRVNRRTSVYSGEDGCVVASNIGPRSAQEPARRQGGPQRLRHRAWVVGTTPAWLSWQPHHQLGRLIRCFHNYLWLQCSTTVKSIMSFHNCYVLKTVLRSYKSGAYSTKVLNKYRL
jgi:hypothetical protein